MTFEEFKNLYKKNQSIDYSKPGWRTEEYDEFLDTLDNNEDFKEWYLIQKLEKENFNYQKYCCLTMANQIFTSTKEGSDAVIYIKSDGSFHIPIHDGGPSLIAINNCPWCGNKLRK